MFITSPLARRRALAFGAALFTIVGANAVSATPAGAQVAPCTQDISTDHTLTADTTCRLRVVAPNVTINLGGFRLTGLVFGVVGNVRVTNGTVAGSINLPTSGNRLDFLTVRDSPGFAVQVGDDAVIVLNRFVGNATAVDHFFGNGGTVAFNRFEGNSIGLNIAKGSDLFVVGNTFRNNGRGVNLRDEDSIRASNNLIVSNTFTGNRLGVRLELRCSPAASFRGCAGVNTGNAIVGNRFEANQSSGILVLGSCAGVSGAPVPPQLDSCAGVGTRITQNVLINNGRTPVNDANTDPNNNDGVTFSGNAESARRVTITANVARANAGLGIEFPGVVDGGTNRASGNGDARQCLGVACGA